ncbi:hypothetical protein ABZX40_13720 [Streptomyces sp. NPDC004610]|uniref:hypothetical protein n=1 Tax=unclassified Streptomyces TaxID=2593676 RepID=UPI00339FB055
MARVIKYGDVLMVASGAIMLIAAQPHFGWWFGWGVAASAVAASHIYRARLARR